MKKHLCQNTYLKNQKRCYRAPSMQSRGPPWANDRLQWHRDKENTRVFRALVTLLAFAAMGISISALVHVVMNRESIITLQDKIGVVRTLTSMESATQAQIAVVNTTLCEQIKSMNDTLMAAQDKLHLLAEDFLDYMATQDNRTTIIQEYDVEMTGAGDFVGGVAVRANLVRVALDEVRALHFLCIMPTNVSYVVPAAGAVSLIFWKWVPALTLDGYNLLGQSVATTSDKWAISDGTRMVQHQFNTFFNTFIFVPQTTLPVGTTVDITEKLNLFLNVF